MTLLNNAGIINSPKEVLKMLIARKHKTVFVTVAIAVLPHHPVYLNRNVAYGTLVAKQEKRTVLVTLMQHKGWER
jgi:hypothetical protein